MSSIERSSFGWDLTDDYDHLVKDVFPSAEKMWRQDVEKAEQMRQEIWEMFEGKGYSEEEFRSLCKMTYHDICHLGYLHSEDKLTVAKILELTNE
jgi:Fe-S oxidoreductase